jgi:hypothetical protein
MKEMMTMTSTGPDEPNDIDTLMSIDPLDLSTQDLDRIIAYQRKQRAAREAGVRTKKPRGEAPPAVSLETLLGASPKPAPVNIIRRR